MIPRELLDEPNEREVREMLALEEPYLSTRGLAATDAGEPVTTAHLEALADAMGIRGMHALATKYRRLAAGVRSL